MDIARAYSHAVQDWVGEEFQGLRDMDSAKAMDVVDRHRLSMKSLDAKGSRGHYKATCLQRIFWRKDAKRLQLAAQLVEQSVANEQVGRFPFFAKQ